MSDVRPVGLIPAYKPEAVVVDIARGLMASGVVQALAVVDDGSGEGHEHIFAALGEIPGTTLLRHYVNLGKGAALKTGINHIACAYPDAVGIVTLDADGQHLLEDVVKIAQGLEKAPDRLVLGSREFDTDVPLRSRFGNAVTRGVMRVCGGVKLKDTQTGLRGIPRAMFPALLNLKTSHYDFELDMLLKSKEQGVAIQEIAIQTVYFDQSRGSHFNPFLDSFKIYLVFLRFNLSSIVSVVIDYTIFSTFFALFGNLFASQFAARFSAGVVNYQVNRRFVFKSDRSHKAALTLYFIALAGMGLLSYGLIHLMDTRLGINIYLAKVFAESLLYVASFVVQREIVFTRGGSRD